MNFATDLALQIAAVAGAVTTIFGAVWWFMGPRIRGSIAGMITRGIHQALHPFEQRLDAFEQRNDAQHSVVEKSIADLSEGLNERWEKSERAVDERWERHNVEHSRIERSLGRIEGKLDNR